MKNETAQRRSRSLSGILLLLLAALLIGDIHADKFKLIERGTRVTQIVWYVLDVGKSYAVSIRAID